MKLKLRWLKLASIIGLVLFMAAGANHAQAFKSEEAKHIILIIGDGMQLEHEIAASRYLYGKGSALEFHKFPYKGFMSTWDVTTYNRYAAAYGADPYDPEAIDPYVGYDPAEGGARPYPAQKNHINDDYFLTELSGKYPATDSASAASAWATGIKTDDGNIAWLPGDPASGALKTVAELLREKKGRSIGVVSTVPFSHATPAALTVLRKNPKGFFLMLEQGDIDWANHANDYKRMIGTMCDLNECVREVIDFVNQPGDGINWYNTLVIVTADHGNSYMRLNDDMKLGAGDLPEQNGATYPGGEVTYASTEHTNELVTLYATGNGRFRRIFHEYEGSWYPRTRIIDNTQLFHIMMAAAGCPVESPLSLIENMGSSVELEVEERN